MRNLLRGIKNIGAKIYLENGGLKLAALPGAVGPELLAEIKSHKAELVAWFTDREKILPPLVGRNWLAAHHKELDVAGWSRPDLYRRSGYKPGLVWYAPWHRDPTVTIDPRTGAVVFAWVSNSRKIVQRATPPAKQSGFCAFLPSSDTATQRLGGNNTLTPFGIKRQI